MKGFLPKISCAIGSVLAMIATLKLVQFLRIPVSQVETDPVVALLTNRELLLLASLFELAIAYLLLRSVDHAKSALLILYFSACSSIYQIGLLLQGDRHHCSCLGAATDWLGADATTWLSRAMLVTFWISGFMLLPNSRKEFRHQKPATAVWAFLLVATAAGIRPGAVIAGQISVSGDLRSSYEYGGKSSEETKPFRATFDESALLLTYLPPSPPHKYAVPPLSNIFFVSKEFSAVVSLSSDMDVAVAELRRPEYAWQLGNCVDGLASRVFMTIRCLELFSEGEGSAAQTRPLAAASTAGGDPFSVISEANYVFSHTAEGQVLNCEVRVSKLLKGKWRSAPLLNPGLDVEGETEDFRRAQASLVRYPNGFLLERMKFSRFTNVAGLRFPTVAEFWKYTAPRTNIAGPVKEVPYGEATLSLRLIEHSAARTGPVAFPHVQVPTKITVTEARLSDRSLHIGGVNYETNALTSLEISPQAKAEYARVVELARKQRFQARILKILSLVLLAALFMGPFLIIKLVRSRRGLDGPEPVTIE